MGYIGNKPAQGLFDTQNIKDGGVQTADIADSAVTESKVADGSIQTAKIANGAVTAAKIADGAAVPSQTGQAGKYLTTDGTTASWDTVDLTPYATTTALANAVANASNWDTAYSWGDHSVQGYATTAALTAAVANSSNWDTAFGWGNHASVGYLVAADIVGKMNTSGGTFTGNVGFGDNVKAQFGAGNDLQIYHTGSYSAIQDVGTGGLFIGGSTQIGLLNSALSEYMINANENGAVTLYYDNSAKLDTTNAGITVTGTVTADGVKLGDGDVINVGASNDLQIYHSGSHSYINDQGTGDLYITGANQVRIGRNGTYENGLVFNENGAIQLYYDNAEKLATTSTGVSVTGTVSATAFSGDGSGLTGVDAVTKSATAPSSPSNGDLWYDTDDFTLYMYDGSEWITVKQSLSVSGGSQVVQAGGFQYHVFTSSGNLAVSKGSAQAEYLVVAGGGGSGKSNGAAGGGAGGLLSGSISLSVNTYTIQVGAGGVRSNSRNLRGGNGTNSKILLGASTLVNTIGGGGSGSEQNDGGSTQRDGASGGSGGGGVRAQAGGGNGGAGTAGQGNAGGSNVSDGSPHYRGGGGGGAGAAGQNGSASGGGNGGIGMDFSEWASHTGTGDQGYYAGGGAGASYVDGGAGGQSGTGGLGGGGEGGSDTTRAGNSGSVNTGGGGGGHGSVNSDNGGDGGSGIVIIRYPI